MGVLIRMSSRPVAPLLLLLLAVAAAQDPLDIDSLSRNFNCPEPNGFFPDPEQCDLYYECEDGVAEAQFCEDGLLFDYSVRNRERCKLPSDNVDCGLREFIQEPSPDIVDKDKCPHSNGFFNHPDETVCDRFHRCDKGRAFEMSCAPPLVFDVKIGGCTFVEAISEDARDCSTGQLVEIDGFSCPVGERVGPQNLIQQHPVYPHPTDCQYFFTCYFGRDPNKFGCSDGQVFDAETQICKLPEDVRDCRCWYDCEAAQSPCRESGQCNADCSCGTIEVN